MQPRRQLLADGERLAIGRRALDIVSVLAEAGGEIVTKDELLEAVWPGVTVEENALQVHIVALRKALGPEADRLQTIRGVGYKLEIDAESPAGAAAPAPEMSASPGPADPPRPAAPLPAPGPSRAAAWIGAAGTHARTHKFALALAGLLIAIAGAWTFLGSELGLRPQERIPVVVRALTATGGANQAESALAGGITDELIDRLRRIPDLKIATATSDGTVAGDGFTDAYVVDGTIRSSGDRLRVTVRLSDAKGEVVWSDTLDRGMSDLFDMQEEIAAAIAGALSVSFEVGANSARYGGTDNPEAYAAYMQYSEHALDFDQSVPLGYLERAVALDPDFGKATSALAGNYGQQIVLVPTPGQAEALLARMDETSERALAANSEFWFGQATRGWYFLSRRDFPSAERQMRRVAELDQGDDAQLRGQLAIYAIHLGRLEKSISISESNEQIDPIYRNEAWQVVYLGWARRFEDAIEEFERLSRYEDRNLQAFTFHTYFAYLLAGREEDAEKFAQDGAYPFAGRLRAFRANRPSPTMSRQQLRQWASEWGAGSQITTTVAALFAAYEGDEHTAVELLRIAYERPGGTVLFFLWHPALAEARKTDEFEQFVTDLGLVEAWRESGDWGDFCRPVSQTEITCH